jgi:hypothetical protein
MPAPGFKTTSVRNETYAHLENIAAFIAKQKQCKRVSISEAINVIVAEYQERGEFIRSLDAVVKSAKEQLGEEDSSNATQC